MRIKKKIELVDERRKLRPLIKWTGGKYKEFARFSHLIPSYEKYYEPFFGGGGVFFSLQPTGVSFLNDRSADLYRFYSLVGDCEFNNQLQEYSIAWNQATKLAKNINGQILPAFQSFVSHLLPTDELLINIKECIQEISVNDYSPLFEESFIIEPALFKRFLLKSLKDKFSRIKNIQQKESKNFSEHELMNHLETGVKSALYLYLRHLSNKAAKGDIKLHVAKATANWYFVREFCYASMFRYNKKGDFNIPYGGINYNNKKFKNKVTAISSPAVEALFANAFIYNLDFEEFLEQTSPSANDFVFLDPPYDSEFSEYDQNSFTKNDQIRLRDTILNCKAKCMVVIKETDFIRDLYAQKEFRIMEFDKTYTYNVRGRNNRGTKHLVIMNY